MLEKNYSGILCWDLDETLGNFRRIAYSMDGGTDSPVWLEPLCTRYGIKSLLAELRRSGYIHVLTTAGTKPYADLALEQSGLRRYFTEVYGRDTVFQRDWGKEYRCVAERFGLSDSQMRKRALVIGDSPGDQPMDIEGLVFLHLSSSYDARVIKPFIDRLTRLGRGSFIRGYKQLYESTPDIDHRGFNEKRAEIQPGITALLEYRTNSGFLSEGDKVVPTICDVIADNYRKTNIKLR